MAKAEIVKNPVDAARGEAKRMALGSIFESVLTIVMGVLLLIWPNTVMQVLGWLLGLFFIVKGLYQIFDYFAVRGQLNIFNNDLLFGVISVIIGILFLAIGQDIENVFRIIVGIWLVYESLVQMNAAVKMSAMRLSAAPWAMVICLISLAMGICMLVYQGALSAMIAWFLIVAGVLGIMTDAVIIKYIDKFADYLTGKKPKAEK